MTVNPSICNWVNGVLASEG